MAKKRALRGDTLRGRVRAEPAKASPERPALGRDVQFRYMLVTPDQATRWLEGKVKNRTLSDRHVEQLARDMRSGQWVRTADTIKFDGDGCLIDGQHRLWAVFHADVPVWMDVAYNVPDEAMLRIDTNRPRSFANHLEIEEKGTITDPKAVAAVARWWFFYDTITDSGQPILSYKSLKATHPELRAALLRHPQIPEAVAAIKAARAARVATKSVLAFVFSGAMLEDRVKASTWLEQVARGVNLSDDSPSYRLRERFANSRLGRASAMEPEEQAAVAMKSWNAFKHGRPVKTLRYTHSEGFPRFGGPSSEP